MKIISLIGKVAPYFFKNHLFVSPQKLSQRRPTIDNEYDIRFPADLNNIEIEGLSDIDTNYESLYTESKSGNLFCFVIWRGKLVHRSLVQTSGTVQMEGDRWAFKLSAGEAYIHGCYTAAGHRGKGLYTTVLNRILTHFTSDDKHFRIYIACRQKNSSSIHGIVRAGFIYSKSSMILGILSGRLRIRLWYLKRNMVQDIFVNPREEN